MPAYRSLFIEESGDSYARNIVERDVAELGEDGVLIKVHYSSLNFKDAMSSHGNKGVTKSYPHQPGIDAAGTVEASADENFKVGDSVIVTGYDLGMNTAGGLGQYIRVPAAWLLPCPEPMTLAQSMQYGTAGLTAQLCIDKLEQNGLAPSSGPVLVTGATGGVGSIAVALLANAGYSVVASSGKPEQADFLTSLGAAQIVDRNEFSAENKRPLLKESYAAAVDVVGGDTLANVIKSVVAGGSVACCGLVQSPNLPLTVLPFILRGVNLLGVDSVEVPLAVKRAAWDKLAASASMPALNALNQQLSLDQVPEALEQLYAGGMVGHRVVALQE